MSIVFIRNGSPVTAKITNTVLEPLGNSDKRQVVFFCQDADGRRYRVPKNEVFAKSAHVKTAKKKQKPKQAKRKRRKEKYLC
jgi:hypothetical protein